MDHPTIERIERTGHERPVKIRRLVESNSVYWDPIEWMKENRKKQKQKA